MKEEVIEKEVHRFYIDEPVTIWRRYNYEIVGDYNEAVKFMLKELENPELDDNFIDSEFIYDSESPIGCRELFNESGEELG